MRGEPRHFVYSKLMCWVAPDRAVRLSDMLDATGKAAGWAAARDQIRAAIETEGWSEPAGAYSQSFGSDDLDASSLMLLLTGFLSPEDARMRSTIDAIAARLTDERGFVYRYLDPDGLGGEEGTFAICTFWLVQCLAEIGELGRARQLFDRLAG
jgi:GH15 family glucan-1,4-alpha-glucosidase